MDAQRLELRAPHPPSRHAKRSKWLELAAAQRGRTIALAAIATPRFLKIVSIYNGILLSPHLDAAFDRGFITVADDGAIVVSDALDAGARATLVLDRPLRVRGLADGHRAYLPWHRERVFRKSRG